MERNAMQTPGLVSKWLKLLLNLMEVVSATQWLIKRLGAQV